MAGSERAWVIGGSGTVGRAVVQELARRGLDCSFTWHESENTARELERLTGARALRFDASKPQEVDGWVQYAVSEFGLPRVLVYAAGISAGKSLAELDVAEFEHALRVNVTAPFALLRALGAAVSHANAKLDAVLLGALDRGQSLPLPVHFASSQGALSALTMAIARELGPLGVRVNQIALGVLEAGLSRTLDAAVIDQYLKFSALRRRGSPAEVARAVAWLALENTYITGKVIPVNGGI
ncbi:MAG: SDR family NAD(P)-dependent oxidoreductase [Myxococcota bacterium]